MKSQNEKEKANLQIRINSRRRMLLTRKIKLTCWALSLKLRPEATQDF
jgi:hypothetical protein